MWSREAFEARVARSAPSRAAASPRGFTGSSSARNPSDVAERVRCDTFAWVGKGDKRDPGGQRESRQNVQGDPLTPGHLATLPRASRGRDPCYLSFGGVCASFAACLNHATGQRQTFTFDDLRLTPHKPPPPRGPLAARWAIFHPRTHASPVPQFNASDLRTTRQSRGQSSVARVGPDRPSQLDRIGTWMGSISPSPRAQHDSIRHIGPLKQQVCSQLGSRRTGCLLYLSTPAPTNNIDECEKHPSQT